MKQCIDCKRHKEESEYTGYQLAHASGLMRSCKACIKLRIAQTKQVSKRTNAQNRLDTELAKALAKYTQTVADIHARFDIR